MLNKVMLIGHLGQAPQLRRTQGGERYALLSLATSERWRDKATGEARQRTQWHRVVVWAEPALDFIEKHLTKGSKVWVEGSLASRYWTDEKGIERTAAEVIVKLYHGAVIGLDKARGVPAPASPDDYGVDEEINHAGV